MLITVHCAMNIDLSKPINMQFFELLQICHTNYLYINQVQFNTSLFLGYSHC